MKIFVAMTGLNVLSYGVMIHRSTINFREFSSYLSVLVTCFTLEPIAYKIYERIDYFSAFVVFCLRVT